MVTTIAPWGIALPRTCLHTLYCLLSALVNDPPGGLPPDRHGAGAPGDPGRCALPGQAPLRDRHHVAAALTGQDLRHRTSHRVTMPITSYKRLHELLQALEIPSRFHQLLQEMDPLDHSQSAAAPVARPRHIYTQGQATLAFIAAVVMAALSSAHRPVLEVLLDVMHQHQSPLVGPIRRFLAGERDLATLQEGLEQSHALLIQAILEGIAHPDVLETLLWQEQS